MPSSTFSACSVALLVATGSAQAFNPLEHLGGNGQWFPSPQRFNISGSTPAGCSVDQAAFVSRHGSRYPDQSAYNQWTDLYSRIKNATFSTDNAPELNFLRSWQPVLNNPTQQISQVSLTGYKELYDMGVDFRFKYPDFYRENTPFTMWANNYAPAPRVIDSARLFARGYLGPNSSTYGNIYVVNSTDPRAIFNSLAPSDLCPRYNDDSGAPNTTIWGNTYLPEVQARINNALQPGTINFTQTDVSIFPYLCGFETQITGRRSPWCDVFTANETLAYEYTQDLRYWYGTGLGTDLEKLQMLPFLSDLVSRFVDGPNATYTNNGGDNKTHGLPPTQFQPNPLIAAFTNDGQINQLAAAIGVFDNEPQLPNNYAPPDRLFRASYFVTMRGTIGFERLNCGSSGLFIRIRLNDAVYPVANCASGPGSSCPLASYKSLVQSKLDAAGNLLAPSNCNVTNPAIPSTNVGTTFLQDISLPFERLVRP